MEQQELLEALWKALDQNKQTIPFSKLAEDYLELYAMKRKRSAYKDITYIDNYLSPAFGGRDIATITTVEIQRIHSNISRKYPIAANRAIEVLSKMFSLALQWGYFHGKNPCKHVVHNKEESRERYLSNDEALRLFRVMEDLEPAVQAILYLYIITGRRKEELRNLTWDKVHFKAGYIEMLDQKKNEKLIIPLSKMSRELLKALPRINERVFVHTSGRNRGRTIGIEKQWISIKKKAGLTDVTIHDFRRTCGTWLYEQGETLDAIKEVLNHSSVNTTMIYARMTEKVKLRAYEKLGASIEKLRENKIVAS